MNNKFLISIVLAFVLMITSSIVCAQDEELVFNYASDKMPCEVVPVEDLSETAALNKSILGDVNESDWVIGPEDAAITIIEYSDFQCPYCRNVSLSLIDYQKKHPNDVRLVYRHFPLSFHPKAIPAGAAADAAGDQGMFFDAADYLFEHQSEWSGMESNEDFSAWLIEKFKQFSDLDFDKWYLAYSDPDLSKELSDTYDRVIETGIIGGTPTVFVNFVQTNDISEKALDQKIQETKLKDYVFNECPNIVIEEGVSYKALIETDAGNLHVDLFPETAPMAVNSFKFLAENDWFNNNNILKKQNGFMVQTGDITNTMYGYPGYYFATEYDESHKFDGAGYLGMANSGRDKNGSQYFISYDLAKYYTDRIMMDSAAAEIDESTIKEYVDEKIEKFSKAYTVFGRVIEEDLPLLDQLNENVMIKKITVIPSK